MENVKDNIYIIGSGAIGKALAVCLKLDNKNVVLLRGSIDDKSTAIEKIQISLDDRTELEALIEVSTLSNFPELDGIVVLTNKSYGNEKLAKALKGKTNNSPVVILQNGLGVEQVFVDNDFPEVYRCVLFVTSQVISVNKIRFKPVSVCPIGRLKGNEANLERVVDQLNSHGFRFSAELNIQAVIWKKAIINSVFNSICPLLDVDNGIFHREEEALKIAKRVIEECVAISKEKGIFLNSDEVAASLLLISKASDGQLISTLQDIKNRRETEIATLNFEIVRIAKGMNKGNLVMETELLGELTRLKSDISR
jgi:2-dehydropantoate 2-reductase